MFNEVNQAKWREECGVFGIFSPDDPVAQLCYLGLFSLQHRGQEGAGIVVTDGMHIDVKKGLGLMTEAFKDGIPTLKGHCAIGHVRYSTIGANSIANVQPMFAYFSNGLIHLAHNGSLTNAQGIRQRLEKEGGLFQTTADSEVILNLIAQSEANTLEEKISESLKQVEGAYSLVIMSGDKLIGIRDPRGFRPLCLGQCESGGYVLASETCALEAVDARFIRDIEPGEMVVIDKTGVRTHSFASKERKHLCVFEYVYFARPDSDIDGENVWQSRFRLGEQLANECAIEADIVVPVPDTGIAAAIGFSAKSGVPYVDGLIKNRYVGRTFILPEQKNRVATVKIKLSPIKANVAGKRIILIDDSIVRGTTSARIISLLREAGAKEVHLCISSPPITHSCYYGIDTSVGSDLIASKLTPEKICQQIGADSLHYLSLGGLYQAVKDPQCEKMCNSCFNGIYPTNIDECLKVGGGCHE